MLSYYVMPLNADQINAISELVLNTLKGNIKLTPNIVATLKPYKTALGDLAKRRHSVTNRRALLLKQKGDDVCCMAESSSSVSLSSTIKNLCPLLEETLSENQRLTKRLESFTGTLAVIVELLQEANEIANCPIVSSIGTESIRVWKVRVNNSDDVCCVQSVETSRSIRPTESFYCMCSACESESLGWRR